MLKLFSALSLGDIRRHPWLYLWLITGLILAGALLTGVESLNKAARASFTQAEQGLTSPYQWRLHSVLGGHRISQSLYAEIRRAGITVSPVIQQRLKLDDDRWVYIRGAELPPEAGDPAGAWVTYVDKTTAENRGWSEGQSLRSEKGTELAPLRLKQDLGPWLLMDLGEAARLVESGPWLTYLEVPPLTDTQEQWLRSRLGDTLVLRPLIREESGTLLDAFSLNLTALSMLSFLVGLLLAFHALERLVQHRQHNIDVLHKLGIGQKQWMTALFIELSLLALFTGLVGSIVGINLASLLAPGVAETLISLYGMEKPLKLDWTLGHGLFCISILFAALALMITWLLRPQGSGRKLLKPLAFGIVIAMLGLTLTAQSQTHALMLTGITVLLAVVLLPIGLQIGSRLLSRLAPNRSAPVGWAFWDLADASRRLVIPIIAITLALGSAISTRVLVGSFEKALGQYLDARLHADLYLFAEEETLLKIKPELAQQESIDLVQGRTQRQGEYAGHTVMLKGYNDQLEPWSFLPFVENQSNWWQQLLSGEGCAVNEPMARRHGLELGQAIDVVSGSISLVCNVVGVYYDYGNPKGEVVTPIRTQVKTFGRAPLDAYSLVLNQGYQSADVAQQLQQRFELPEASLISQDILRGHAERLFHRTFAITDALAWLTLLVAMVSWFASLAAQQRSWMKQQALVAAMGMTSKQIANARLLQLGCQMGLVALAAIALGLVLGWQLITLVNPLSFGWSMPVRFDSGNWWQGVLGASTIVMVIAYGPLLWQAKRALTDELSREEA